jgi:hypothetical protein
MLSWVSDGAGCSGSGVRGSMTELWDGPRRSRVAHCDEAQLHVAPASGRAGRGRILVGQEVGQGAPQIPADLSRTRSAEDRTRPCSTYLSRTPSPSTKPKVTGSNPVWRVRAVLLGKEACGIRGAALRGAKYAMGQGEVPSEVREALPSGSWSTYIRPRKEERVLPRCGGSLYNAPPGLCIGVLRCRATVRRRGPRRTRRTRRRARRSPPRGCT